MKTQRVAFRCESYFRNKYFCVCKKTAHKPAKISKVNTSDATEAILAHAEYNKPVYLSKVVFCEAPLIAPFYGAVSLDECARKYPRAPLKLSVRVFRERKCVFPLFNNGKAPIVLLFSSTRWRPKIAALSFRLSERHKKLTGLYHDYHITCVKCQIRENPGALAATDVPYT